VRGTTSKSGGYFATGLPELPDGVQPDALSTTLPAAVIEREADEALAEFLHAPVGPVLDAT
jgi:hypothetical protein